MNGTEEVASGLVIARGDSAILLEPGKEVFEQMARLVPMFIVRPLFLAILFGRDDDRFARLFQRFVTRA